MQKGSAKVNYNAKKWFKWSKNLLEMQETWVKFLDGEDSWRRGMPPTPYSCLENLLGQRSSGYSPRSSKESDMTE